MNSTICVVRYHPGRIVRFQYNHIQSFAYHNTKKKTYVTPKFSKIQNFIFIIIFQNILYR